MIMSSEQDAYNQIVTRLKGLEIQTVEIEILPSALCPPGPPQVIQDEQAVGIPKALLIPAFKHALRVLALGQPHNPGTVMTREQRLNATMVVLLVAPEHLTAANIRKRNLLALCESASNISQTNGIGIRPEFQEFTRALQVELNLLDSLFTSPLHKHAKSPTLWSHRRWLITKFLLNTPGPPRASEPARTTGQSSTVSPSLSKPSDLQQNQVRLLSNEFEIVSRAALQHPRNYPAFDYLRRLVTHSMTSTTSDTMLSSEFKDALCTICEKTHKLALQNLGDTSIWAFWQYISNVTVSHDPGGSADQNVTFAVKDTLETALRLRWRGEAIWGCLRSALASGEIVGICEDERRHGHRILKDWLVQCNLEGEGEGQDSVVTRDLEELSSIVGRAVKWIDLHWESDI